jgi:hypothetical protein
MEEKILIRTEDIRFVVFGQGRTGSKLLIELLRSNPDIDCDGEVLNGYYWNRVNRRLILPLLHYYPLPLFRRNARKSQKAVYGFKLFDDHIHRPGHILSCMHREGWRIIHIQRRDLIAQAISGVVARQTSRWHRRKGESVALSTVVIEPDKFLAVVQERVYRAAKIERLLAKVPRLDIIYEDDLVDIGYWEKTSVRLMHYLGLPVKLLSAEIVKTWEQPYSELIANYTELIEAVGRSSNSYLVKHIDPSFRDTTQYQPRLKVSLNREL